MAKWIRYSLVVLLLNLVASVVIMSAFMTLLVREDPILAAAIGLLATPPLVFQPWLIAFFFFVADEGWPLVALLTTVVTMLVYGPQEWPRRVLRKLKARKPLLMIGFIVFLAVSVAFARYLDFPPLRNGVPRYVKDSRLVITESRYYCVFAFIDSEWLWRARVSEQDLALLEVRHGLTPLSGTDVPRGFIRQPPYWWNPRITDRTRVLSTPVFPLGERGPDGWHALATWNDDDRILHMWIKNNF